MRTQFSPRHFCFITCTIAMVGLLGPTRIATATLPDGSGPFGAPRPWEGGMGVGPYSVGNLRTGHVLTVLHVVSWPGTGGGLSFNLYHNSPDDNSGIVVTPTMEKEHNPFDPATEPIWRTSFSSSLKDYGTSIDLTRDDGTIDTFTLDGDVYVPPAGVFDSLVKLEEPDQDGALYVLTSKHQSVARYGEYGWLLSVSDASGNTITCQYDTNNMLISVTDATYNVQESRPGRKLEFDIDSAGRLLKVIDPQYNNGAGREWELTRSSTTHTFIKLTDPLDHDIDIGYDLHGRITSLGDKNGKTTSFHYDDAKLVLVEDPYPLTTDVNFAYTADTGGASHTVFTDRKGKSWTYHFSAADNLVSMTNPLSKTWYAAYTATPPQLAHHATSVTNPLTKTWYMEWDEFGNLESSTDPIGHKTTRTYDSLNNLTSVTPPLNDEGDGNTAKTVTIEYEDEKSPTLPTKIIEPSADGVEDPAETQIFYYGDQDDPAWIGKVMEVVDPNGVRTSFTYDDYGQPASETENEVTVEDESWPTATTSCGFDASGYPTETVFYSNGGGVMCSAVISNAGGEFTATSCGCVVYYEPGIPVAPLGSWMTETSYDAMSRPLASSRMVEDMQHHLTGGGHEQSERTYTMTYDAVGRPTAASITTNEPSFNTGLEPLPLLTRNHAVSYIDSTGTTTYTGPDGEAIVVTTDDASRTYQVSRTLQTGRILSTTNAYDDAGQMLTVTNGNNTTTSYTYDIAGRVETVTHRRGTSGAIFLMQEYEWTPDGLLLMVSEDDGVSPTSGIADAVTYYGYDNRSRLISEERVDYGGTGVDAIEYHVEYTYDLGGNRLSKSDVLNDVTTTYRYDVGEENEGSVDGNQHNNRLLSYETFNDMVVVERGWYHYGRAGHVNRFIKWKASDGTTTEGYKRVHAYAFHYNKAGQLWIAASMRGELGVGTTNVYAELAPQYDLPEGSVLMNAVGVAAMEYRYDGSGRQRYLVRQRTPDEDLQPIAIYGAAGGTWSDYVGDEPYHDYFLIMNAGNPPTTAPYVQVNDYMSHLSGVGYDDMNTNTPTSRPVYAQGDQIGTTRRLTATDTVGNPASAPLLARSVYTAFGEIMDQTTISGVAAPASFRHGYAGAWGYQAGGDGTVTAPTPAYSYWGGTNNEIIAAADPLTELSWLHVGERYYDPASGRFVMRDPIGILGGLNTYECVFNNPVTDVDPSGLESHDTGTLRIILRDEMRAGKSHQEATNFIANSNGGALVAGAGAPIAAAGCAGISAAAARFMLPYIIAARLATGRPNYGPMPLGPQGSYPSPTTNPPLPPLPPWEPVVPKPPPLGPNPPPLGGGFPRGPGPIIPPTPPI